MEENAESVGIHGMPGRGKKMAIVCKSLNNFKGRMNPLMEFMQLESSAKPTDK